LGPDRLCLISDASAGTGLASGERFSMGSACGIVSDLVALSEDGGSFCGSTSFLSDVVRFCVREVGLPITHCARMASTTPARLLGLSNKTGSIAPGLAADLVILNEEFDVEAVVQGGIWTGKEELNG
jgi:N-acetylglucosamine-6-phosphate deacetylase